jgi:hypothetical protein
MAAPFDMNAFKTAIQNAIANGITQNLPAAAAPAAGGGQPKSSVNKPTEFNGDIDKYDDFKRQTHLYILANTRQFPDDQSKILFVTSYMTQRLANTWAQNFYEMKEKAAIAIGPNAPIDLGSWTDFKTALDATFTDPNLVRNAERKLRELKQGRNQHAEEFLTEFDICRRKAGYVTGYDQFLIGLLHTALKPDLLVVIYTGVPPTTYDDWCAKAILHDGLNRQLRDALAQQHHHAPAQGHVQRQQQPTQNNYVPNHNHQNYGNCQNNQFRGNQHQRQARPQGQGQAQPQRMVLPQGGTSGKPS